MGSFSFTTITPNVGRGYLPVCDPAMALGMEPAASRWGSSCGFRGADVSGHQQSLLPGSIMPQDSLVWLRAMLAMWGCSVIPDVTRSLHNEAPTELSAALNRDATRAQHRVSDESKRRGVSVSHGSKNGRQSS